MNSIQAQPFPMAFWTVHWLESSRHLEYEQTFHISGSRPVLPAAWILTSLPVFNTHQPPGPVDSGFKYLWHLPFTPWRPPLRQGCSSEVLCEEPWEGLLRAKRKKGRVMAPRRARYPSTIRGQGGDRQRGEGERGPMGLRAEGPISCVPAMPLGEQRTKRGRAPQLGAPRMRARVALGAAPAQAQPHVVGAATFRGSTETGGALQPQGGFLTPTLSSAS